MSTSPTASEAQHVVAGSTTGSPAHVLTTSRSRQQQPRTLAAGLFWVGGIVLAFVVPLLVTLGAIFVSSYGITLPIYVAVP